MITLAESIIGMTNKIDIAVIDEFRRYNYLFDVLPFDNIINNNGGSTLAYNYKQLSAPSLAGFREINGKYTPKEAKQELKVAYAKIFGGAYEIDRVLIDSSEINSVANLDFQIQQQVKATANGFLNELINSKGIGASFKGLDEILKGSDTEIDAGGIDLSDTEKMDANYKKFLDILDDFLKLLNEEPDLIILNKKMGSRMTSIGRRAGYYSRNEISFGKKVSAYQEIPFIDLGSFYNGNTGSKEDIIKISSLDGTTDIYAVKLGLDAFHGISKTGNNIIKQYLPNFNNTDSTLKGEVEMVAGAVLKNSKMAGVLRNIKVA